MFQTNSSYLISASKSIYPYTCIYPNRTEFIRTPLLPHETRLPSKSLKSKGHYLEEDSRGRLQPPRATRASRAALPDNCSHGPRGPPKTPLSHVESIKNNLFGQACEKCD